MGSQFTHEHQPWPVRILRAPFVEQIPGGREGVEHKGWRAEELQKDDVA